MPDSLDWENLDDDDNKDARVGPGGFGALDNFATSAEGQPLRAPEVDSAAETADPGTGAAQISINAPPEAMLGSIFVGRYELISIIGAGGMGVIFLAKQVFLERTVAIKLLKNNLASVKARMRFHQEAKAASALSHPGIVKITDFGVDEHDRPYMVMEAVNGCTFADLLRERYQLSFKELLPIYLEICDALSEAHNKNVIHRDLKPSNIMLVTAGDGNVHIKLLDFGIAKLRDDQENTLQDLTRTGEALGTPLYMSPEQIKGGKITARTDLYSLGCMLYATITGAPPFVGSNKLDTMEKHCTEAARSFASAAPDADVVPGLESLVMCLLEKNPDDRFINVDQFKNALLDLAAQYKLMPRLDFATVAPGKLYLTGVVPAISQSFAQEIGEGVAARENPATSSKAITRSAVAGSVRAVQPPRRFNRKAAFFILIAVAIVFCGFLFVSAVKERQRQLTALSTKPGDSAARSNLIVESYPTSTKFASAKLTTVSNVTMLSEADWQRLDKDAVTIHILDGSAGDAQFARLCQLSHLQNLVIAPDRLLTNAAMQKLLDAPSLVSLVLEQSHLGKEGLIGIAECKRLKNLALPGDKLVDSDTLSALVGPQSNLRCLSLARCRLDDKAGPILAADKNLARLDVSGNADLTAEFVKGLAPAGGHLQQLFLSSINLGDDARHALGALTNLETLDLSNTTLFDATIDDIGNMGSLGELNLISCNLTAEQWKKLGAICGRKGVIIHRTGTFGFQFEQSNVFEARE